MRAGRAVWTDQACIELVESDPRVIAVSDSYQETLRLGTSSLRELHHVPVVNPRLLLGMGRNTGSYSPWRTV